MELHHGGFLCLTSSMMTRARVSVQWSNCGLQVPHLEVEKDVKFVSSF